MSTVLTLTEPQFDLILKDYFAEGQERKRLTNDEAKVIANRLNKEINIPFVDEEGEAKVLIKIVLKIDRFLYNSLPNELYDAVRSVENGLDEEEVRNLSHRISRLANKKIDIPYLPEVVEFFILNFGVRLILKALQKQVSILSLDDDSNPEVVAVSASVIKKTKVYAANSSNRTSSDASYFKNPILEGIEESDDAIDWT